MFFARALKGAGRVGCLNGRQEAFAPACPARSDRGHRPGPARRVPSTRPAPGGPFPSAGSGAGLSWCPDPPVCRAPSRAGGGNAGRVSCSRPEG